MKTSSANRNRASLGRLVVLCASFIPSAVCSAPETIECTVILDQETGTPIVRAGACQERFTPMSTFKVPLAMIGYDAGVLKDRRSPRWDYDPKFDAPRRARKAVDPTVWQAESILWYSQEITRRLGDEVFKAYVRKLRYGNAYVRGDLGKDDGLTRSWLSSSLRISADEQAAFMRRIVAGDLPISQRAIEATVSIVPSFQTADGWNVQGKIGSGSLRRKNGKLNPARPIGWFVGWAEKGGRKITFARLRVGAERPTEPSGLALRVAFLKELPSLMQGK